MADRERNAVLRVFDYPVWRDWLFWLMAFFVIGGPINALSEYRNPAGEFDVTGQEFAFFIDACLRAAFNALVVGAIGGGIRIWFRRRRSRRR